MKNGNQNRKCKTNAQPDNIQVRMFDAISGKFLETQTFCYTSITNPMQEASPAQCSKDTPPHEESAHTQTTHKG